jgi:uncharacterized membrane protein
MSSRPSQPGRILAIDLARVFAILFMIQGHTIHVLLAQQYRQGQFFDLWLYLRGLTAPVFLSLAGCSFFVVTMRMFAKSPSDISSKVFRRVRRFTMFVGLGYLMHMPARSFADLQYVDSAAWQSWCQVDVLQCIGITLIAMQLLALVARTPQRYAIACVAIGSAIVLSTPLTWSASWSHLPGFASAYLNGNSGSLFPLFPWAGYVFIGASLGYLFITQSSSTSIRVTLIVAAIALLAGNALQRMQWSLYGPIDYWKTSPNLFLIRWGAICLLMTAITAFLRWFPVRSLPLAQRLASESLIAYMVHIAILYGTSWSVGLRQTMGESLNPLQTFLFIILMIVVSCAIAIGWNISKQKVKGLRQAVLDPLFGRTPKSATAD